MAVRVSAAERTRHRQQETIIESDEYRAWSRERRLRLREAVPFAPRPGSRFQTINAVELRAMTLVDMEEAERPTRARAAAEYDWECAEIDREERTGMLRYRLAGYEVSPIIQRIDGWAITTYGIEKLYDYYPIERHRIHEEDDWVRHLAEKGSICPQSLADFTVLHDIVRSSGGGAVVFR